jgi:hypothetical protein
MSSPPPNFSVGSCTNTAALRTRRGCGCCSSVTGAILFASAVFVGLNPWALHMGGRWTPALTWHGIGKLQSTSGAKYGLFSDVSSYLPSRGRSTTGGHNNLPGTAKLCTPRERFIPSPCADI